MEDLINDYWAGHLSNKQQKEFEIRLRQDKAFQKKVELYQTVNEMVLDVDTPQFIRLLEQTEEKLQATSTFQSARIVRLKTVFAIAASIAILILAGYYFILMPPSTDTLYAQYTNQHQSVTLALVQKGTTEMDAVQLEQAFQQRNYPATLQLANSYLEQQQNFSVLLVKGISLLELNRFEEAIITFYRLYNSDALIAPQGLWYQAMTYLKQGDVENCRSILQEIIQTKSFNYQKAIVILDALK